MSADITLQFDREVLSDVTKMQVWVSSANTLPSQIFLYEYDNVSESYKYSRVCRYCDLVNWRTARVSVEDRFIRRSYVYLEAYTDASINAQEASIRSQLTTLLSDLDECTDGTAVDVGFSAGDYTLSGLEYSGEDSAKIALSVWSGVGVFPCLVLRNEGAGLNYEQSGSFLAVAALGDFTTYSGSCSGSGLLWRSSSGTVLMPNARVSEFINFMSGDLYNLSSLNWWSGAEVSGYTGPAGSIYI